LLTAEKINIKQNPVSRKERTRALKPKRENRRNRVPTATKSKSPSRGTREGRVSEGVLKRNRCLLQQTEKRPERAKKTLWGETGGKVLKGEKNVKKKNQKVTTVQKRSSRERNRSKNKRGTISRKGGGEEREGEGSRGGKERDRGRSRSGEIKCVRDGSTLHVPEYSGKEKALNKNSHAHFGEVSHANDMMSLITG